MGRNVGSTLSHIEFLVGNLVISHCLSETLVCLEKFKQDAIFPFRNRIARLDDTLSLVQANLLE